jgi:hypothetical protein
VEEQSGFSSILLSDPIRRHKEIKKLKSGGLMDQRKDLEEKKRKLREAVLAISISTRKKEKRLS